MKVVVRLMVALSWLSLPLIGIAAAANCDISQYDQTPPAAIGDRVTQSADFEWATDADQINGEHWIWHYLLNRGNEALKVNWAKADIETTTAHALEPGGPPLCRRVFVYKVADQADTDAPIIYTSRPLRQNAAVYVADRSANAQQTGTEIATSFLDGGERRDAYLNVRSYSDGKSVYMNFEAPPYLTFGIAGLSTALGDQIPLITEQVKKSGAELEVVKLREFSRAAIAEFGTSSDDEYLVLSSVKGKVEVSFPTISAVERSLTVILFDGDKQPILRSAVTMLLPS
jgi:hypothetical protein